MAGSATRPNTSIMLVQAAGCLRRTNGLPLMTGDALRRSGLRGMCLRACLQSPKRSRQSGGRSSVTRDSTLLTPRPVRQLTGRMLLRMHAQCYVSPSNHPTLGS